MEISIIIPVHNEKIKISRDIHATADFLNRHYESSEIIIVDDGSEDDTSTIAENTETPVSIAKKVIRYERQRGKGFAVRTGMVNSKGTIAMFMDSGLCVPLEYILRGLKLLYAGECDIAHGSRFLQESSIIKPHIQSRQISSWIFRHLLTYLVKIPLHLTDTQCGFKMYRGEVARQLYNECQTDGFMFDIEIILRAVRDGYIIKEFPITWTADHDSRLSQVRTPMRAISELRRIQKMLDMDS